MAFSSEQQRLNYDVFENVYISHAYELYNSSQHRQKALRGIDSFAFSLASILEGLGWLNIGSSIGYFSRDFYRVEVEAAQRRTAFRFLDEYLSRWEYLFDPYWVTIFRKLLDNPILDTNTEFDDGDVLARIFQSCLVRGVHLNSDPSAEAAAIVLDFSRPDEITQLIRFRTSVEEIAQAVEQRAGVERNFGAIPVSVIYAGFAKLVHYLDGFRHAYYSGVEIADPSGMVASQLYRRIAQLQAWRFHFICGTSLDTLQFEFVTRYLDALEITEPERQHEFRQYLRDLALFFRNFHTPRVAKAGGA